MTLQNWFQNKQRYVGYSAKNFAKSSFSDVRKIRNAVVANGTELNGLNLFSQIREIVGQGLEHPLFIISNNTHLFHKTNFEQYLFKHQELRKLTGKIYEVSKFSAEGFWNTNRVHLPNSILFDQTISDNILL